MIKIKNIKHAQAPKEPVTDSDEEYNCECCGFKALNARKKQHNEYLVGVETNPGPKKGAKKSKAQPKKKQPMDVKSLIKSAVKQALIAGGGAIGGYFGGPSMAGLGSQAGALISKITGMGDYQINENSLLNQKQSPSFKTDGRTITIQHREFIGNVNSSIAFDSNEYPLNPGLSQTFPWLAAVAQNFEMYRFRGLVFHFKSTSATAVASTNTALGAIIIATQYNPYRPDFVNKQQMEMHEFTTSCKPADDMLHPCECAPKENALKMSYVRTGAVSNSSEDLRFYDLGVTTVAAVGSQAAAVVGELWVTYEVEFAKPIAAAVGNVVPLSMSWNGGEYASPYYFSYVIPEVYGSLDVSFSAVGAGYDTISFPEWVQDGYYKVTIQWVGTSTANTLPTFAFTNCTNSSTILNRYRLSASRTVSNTGTTGTTLMVDFLLQVTGTGALFTLSGGTLPAAGVSVTVHIVEVPYSFLTDSDV